MLLADAVKIAVAVASLSCRDYDCRNAIPDYDHANRVAAGLKVENAVSVSSR